MVILVLFKDSLGIIDLNFFKFKIGAIFITNWAICKHIQTKIFLSTRFDNGFT